MCFVPPSSLWNSTGSNCNPSKKRKEKRGEEREGGERKGGGRKEGGRGKEVMGEDTSTLALLLRVPLIFINGLVDIVAGEGRGRGMTIEGMQRDQRTTREKGSDRHEHASE